MTKAGSTEPSQPRPTQRQLATALGIGTRQIRNLVEKGMPPALPDALHWYVEFKLEDATKRAAKPASNEKLRGEQLKNRLLEIEVAHAERTIVSTMIHRDRVKEISRSYASAMKSLPQYSAELFGLGTLAEVQLALERIANRMLAIGRGDDPDEVEGTAETAA